MQKIFLTHNQQMRKLRDDKHIECRDSSCKEILCRTGYFNLVNGYKEAFVASKGTNGNHVYHSGTSLHEMNALKEFDDELRALLQRQITKIEEEVRTVVAYKFDEANDRGKIAWYQIEAYNPKNNAAKIMRVISNAYRDVELSQQEYVSYYLAHHKFIPTWIMVKVISFSHFINLVNSSKDAVKQAVCKLYGIMDASGKCNYKLLSGSLPWFRIVRNACAHNERIYTLSAPDSRIRMQYMDLLSASYKRSKDKTIMDLIVYMKYYSPHKEYCKFIENINHLILSLQGDLHPTAFDNVRAALGIKDLTHLHELCKNPKEINYNKLSKM